MASMLEQVKAILTNFSSLIPSGAYSKGEDNNPIVLLFESPGEFEKHEPLVGQTGLNYGVIVATVGMICGINDALLIEKSRAAVVNVCHSEINKSIRADILSHKDELLTQAMVDQFFARMQGKHVLLAFGEIACNFAKRVFSSNANALDTVLLCPYPNTQGMAYMQMGECDKRMKDLKKLEVIGRFVARYHKETGIHGWCELADVWKSCTGESLGWNGGCPDWLTFNA